MHMLNLEVDQLRQQKNMLGSTSSSQEQKAVAAVGHALTKTGELKTVICYKQTHTQKKLLLSLTIFQ